MMQENKIVPETDELAEDALEQVAGGEGWLQMDPNDPALFQPGFIPNTEG